MNGPAGYAVPLKRPAVDVKRLADGGFIFRSPYGMRDAPAHAGVWLKTWATAEPNRIFLVEKNDKGRKRSLSYEQAYASVQQIAAALAAHGQGARRRVAAFAANTIDTALFHLAAAEAGMALATFEPDATGDTLKTVLSDLAPAVVYVDSREQRYAVLELSHEVGAEAVAADELKKWVKKRPKGPDVHGASSPPVPSVGERLYFETATNLSGFGVAARNLTINQEAVAALLPPLGASAALACGGSGWWEPAGTWGLLAVLRAGGTLHIGTAGEGIKPTFLLAHGHELPALTTEPKRLAALERIVILGGAADPALAATIQELAIKARGQKVPLVWGYGAAGTGTLDALLYFDSDIPNNLGLPPPGSYLKLAPMGNDLELRVKPAGDVPLGWSSNGLAPRALDEDGFLATGDAAKLIDPMRPYLGMQWLGRLT